MAAEPRHRGELHRVRGLVDRDPLQEHLAVVSPSCEGVAGQVRPDEQQARGRGRVGRVRCRIGRGPCARRSRRRLRPRPRRAAPAPRPGDAPERPRQRRGPPASAPRTVVRDLAERSQPDPRPLGPVDDLGPGNRTARGEARVLHHQSDRLVARGLDRASSGEVAGSADPARRPRPIATRSARPQSTNRSARQLAASGLARRSAGPRAPSPSISASSGGGDVVAGVQVQAARRARRRRRRPRRRPRGRSAAPAAASTERQARPVSIASKRPPPT